MVQHQAPPPGSVSSERTLEKKREILRAASKVFRSKGLHATGMRDIAAEAGMHAGNLYYYFENKQELLAFCQRESLDELLTTAEHVRSTTPGADRCLFRLIVEHVRVLNESIPGSLAHLEVEALGEPWRQELQRPRDRYESIFRATVRQGQDDGLFRQVDPKVAVLAILGALNWTVKWYQPGGRHTAQSIADEFATLLVRGLLADGTQLSAAASDS